MLLIIGGALEISGSSPDHKPGIFRGYEPTTSLLIKNMVIDT